MVAPRDDSGGSTAGMDAHMHATGGPDRGIAVERTAGWSGVLSRVSWGAVFAGVVIATALQLVLTVLGAAIGLTALDGQDSGKAFGIGAGIWAVLVPLATLFLGGMTAGRLAGVRDKFEGFMHGALVWSVSLLMAAWLLGTGASRLIGSTLNLAGNVAGGAASTAGQVASRSDIDQGDLSQARERARQEAAERGITGDSVRSRVAEVRESAGEVADQAQGIAAGSAWLALLGLGLSLAAAVLGARKAVPREATVRTTTTTRPIA